MGDVTAATPGPWTIEESTPGAGHHFINGADGSCVICPDDGWGSGYRDYETRLANARLIAAAPELLWALKLILQTHDVSCQAEDCGIGGIDLARAALAKAEGR